MGLEVNGVEEGRIDLTEMTTGSSTELAVAHMGRGKM